MPQFLYEKFDSVSSLGLLPKGIPDVLTSNLNGNFELRPYQREAFLRFFYYIEGYPDKKVPVHLAFNMATGSGKTLIMAGLILCLYEKGYRNFLFFVNSNNIIEKTKENFLNKQSSKYLFSEKITFNGKVVDIKEVQNFESTSKNDINICFTTVQKMHSDLHNAKENSLTFEDFEDKDVILISDEAHHLQAKTKQQSFSSEIDKPSWENTIEKIFNQNNQNFLLEFTATLLDDGNQDILNKYMGKIIYRYDIKDFVKDKYSKDIYTFSSKTTEKDRILQAIIISQYRQEVAIKHKVNLKPVVLFKAQKTIAQSKENHRNFNKLIENLSTLDIERVKNRSNDNVIKDAFIFFTKEKITTGKLVIKLKEGFSPEKCLNANDDKDVNKNQLLLNSLESKSNQIRAIFAVQKLNEGWDVLNLFDIVRLYQSRDAKDNKPGKTTISEAQLIGRGARYFPFKFGDTDKFKRKFDEDAEHELSVLEKMYYHCFDDHRYISEIKKALREKGWNIDDDYDDKDLKLKESFKKSSLYKHGLIYINKKVLHNKKEINSFADLGVVKKDFTFILLDGSGVNERIFESSDEDDNLDREMGNTKSISLSKIEKHIVQNALAKNKYLTFFKLYDTFGNIYSVSDFISKKEYLAGVNIKIENYKEELFNNHAKLNLLIVLFKQIESELKNHVFEHKGNREFVPQSIKDVFGDARLHLHKKKNETRLQNDMKNFVENKKWYAFDSLYGTSEERALVEFIDIEISKLEEKYEDIYLIRNEQHFKIHNFKDGFAFAPDFVLFAREKTGKNTTYQIFVEPKGKHLIQKDKWKEDFLLEIKKEYGSKVVEFNKSKKYKITGVPFYNHEGENEFKKELNGVLK